MSPAVDLVSVFRTAGLPEFVLTGAVPVEPAHGCEPPAPYALNKAQTGYTRVPLDDVSRHMLHVSDATPTASSEGGMCYAVAFRRKKPKKK